MDVAVAAPASHRLRSALSGFSAIELAAGAVLLVVVSAAVFGPMLAPYPPALQRFQDGILLPPGSPGHLLGTDQLARDILSRLLVGTRTSLSISLISVLIGLGLGGWIGVVAASRGGWVDAVLMRVMDALLAFPALVLALIIAVSLGPSVSNTVIAIAVVMVPGFARLARARALQVKGSDFVAAARAIGASRRRIIVRHIIPNIWGPLVAQAILAMGSAIPAEATLSFLGLGVQLPNPSWGNMIADGYAILSRSPWGIVFPAIAMVLTVGSASIFGDGIRRKLSESA
jgi:peptide/nickel transport system permease protein